MGGLWPATTGGRVRSLQHDFRAGAAPPGHGHHDAWPRRRPRRPEAAARRTASASSRSRTRFPSAAARRFRPPSSARGSRTIPSISGSGASPTSVAQVRAVDGRRRRRPVRRRLPVRGGERADATAHVPVVLFEHNVEYLIWQRLAALETQPLEARAVRDRMAEAARARGRRVPAGRPDDCGLRGRPARLRSSAPAIRAASIPTGVDTDYFTPRRRRRSARRASSSAARWTGIRTRTPSATSSTRSCRASAQKSRTCRSRSSAATRARACASSPARPGVDVTGTVDDVRPSIGEAAVYVVPLRAGGGTRIKIFEALAMGKAVVSTTVGAEGLALEPGRHFLAADTPHDFAHAVDPAAARPGAAAGAWRRGPRARRSELLLGDGRAPVRRTL